MSAFYDHANSLDWWDGPSRFKQINRVEVAAIQTETMLRLLSTFPGKKIDVGGPTGAAAGLEFETLNIDHAGAKIKADACSMPYADQSFSVIFSAHTIEHVHDVNKFISECDRTLKSSGVMCIVCPDRNLFLHSDSNDLYKTKPEGERTYEEFTPDELLSRVSRLVPMYKLLSFNTRLNNYDFEIIMRKP